MGTKRSSCFMQSASRLSMSGEFVRDGHFFAIPLECSSFLPKDRLHKSSYTPNQEVAQSKWYSRTALALPTLRAVSGVKNCNTRRIACV